MNATEKREYILEGSLCSVCASKIENEVNQLEGTTCSLDVVSKTLSVEMDKGMDIQGILNQTHSIIKKHEPSITVVEKPAVTPGQKILYLSGLSCADCGQAIEDEISRIPGVESVRLDAAAQRIYLHARDEQQLPSLVRDAVTIIQSREPGIRISHTDSLTQAKSPSNQKEKLRKIALYVGAALFVLGMVIHLPRGLSFALYFTSYLLVGGEVVLRALKNLTRGQVFDENFLMSLATIGAFAIGEFPEGVAVMLFYQIGEMFQNMAVNRSRRSIAALMDIRPDYANLRVGTEIRKVSPEEVGIGDLIVVKPGEKIPLDGKIIEGSSALDTSALTGESLPRDVAPGDEVFACSINHGGLLTLEISKPYGESTLSKILELVQHASSKKAPTENYITKFARYYTPVVVAAAVLLAVIPPLFIPGASFTEWLNRALVFLVVSCPCALVISIPLGFFGGIGGASRNGILMKGSNYLDALNRVDTVVFDKTGTLTKGVFKVSEIRGHGVLSDTELLEYAAYAESYSSHPIALSIQKAYGKEIDKSLISEYKEQPGYGIRAIVKGVVVLIGNKRWMQAERLPFDETQDYGTAVHLAIDGVYAGSINITDEVKPDSADTIAELKRMGVKSIAMLTGDSQSSGEKVARDLGLDRVYTGLLPQDKLAKLEELEKDKTTQGRLVFVGDGINDAPVLARADVGIAMGGLGSDAAIEAADVVLMTDEPSKLVTAIRLARHTHRIVWQNIVFALGVKGIILILGAFGIATMWEAVFGDVGVAVIAILNATRVMRVEKKAS